MKDFLKQFTELRIPERTSNPVADFKGAVKLLGKRRFYQLEEATAKVFIDETMQRYEGLSESERLQVNPLLHKISQSLPQQQSRDINLQMQNIVARDNERHLSTVIGQLDVDPPTRPLSILLKNISETREEILKTGRADPDLRKVAIQRGNIFAAKLQEFSQGLQSLVIGSDIEQNQKMQAGLYDAMSHLYTLGKNTLGLSGEQLTQAFAVIRQNVPTALQDQCEANLKAIQLGELLKSRFDLIDREKKPNKKKQIAKETGEFAATMLTDKALSTKDAVDIRVVRGNNFDIVMVYNDFVDSINSSVKQMPEVASVFLVRFAQRFPDKELQTQFASGMSEIMEGFASRRDETIKKVQEKLQSEYGLDLSDPRVKQIEGLSSPAVKTTIQPPAQKQREHSSRKSEKEGEPTETIESFVRRLLDKQPAFQGEGRSHDSFSVSQDHEVRAHQTELRKDKVAAVVTEVLEGRFGKNTGALYASKGSIEGLISDIISSRGSHHGDKTHVVYQSESGHIHRTANYKQVLEEKLNKGLDEVQTWKGRIDKERTSQTLENSPAIGA